MILENFNKCIVCGNLLRPEERPQGKCEFCRTKEKETEATKQDE